MIDTDMAQTGLTIVAEKQTQGKGQRGKNWVDAHGQSLLMSIIVSPEHSITHQFAYNAAVAVAVAEVLLKLCENCDIKVKWPNDMIINDKKTGGILIENIIRGNKWAYSIIGIGLNVLQDNFTEELPYATSLKQASGKTWELHEVRDKVRANILEYTCTPKNADEIIYKYNQLLYRKDMKQRFADAHTEWDATIHRVTNEGLLEVSLEQGNIALYKHGSVEWKWG